jgi:hypothetical protein
MTVIHFKSNRGIPAICKVHSLQFVLLVREIVEHKHDADQREEVKVEYDVDGRNQLVDEHGYELEDHLHRLHHRVSAVHLSQEFVTMLEKGFVFEVFLISDVLVVDRVPHVYGL